MLNGLLTDEQAESLEARFVEASSYLNSETETLSLATYLLNLALRRLANPGQLEDANRYRHVAQLAETVVRSGSVVGYEAEIQDLVTVFLGLG